ncbi:hypothetical protein DFH06DRAFT_1129732 [Mycena polygramma]|nr:hypothetical protein DFH06DRAFT_1129732 [Mycena polygramma]
MEVPCLTSASARYTLDRVEVSRPVFFRVGAPSFSAHIERPHRAHSRPGCASRSPQERAAAGRAAACHFQRKSKEERLTVLLYPKSLQKERSASPSPRPLCPLHAVARSRSSVSGSAPKGAEACCTLDRVEKPRALPTVHTPAASALTPLPHRARARLLCASRSPQEQAVSGSAGKEKLLTLDDPRYPKSVQKERVIVSSCYTDSGGKTTQVNQLRVVKRTRRERNSAKPSHIHEIRPKKIGVQKRKARPRDVESRRRCDARDMHTQRSGVNQEANERTCKQIRMSRSGGAYICDEHQRAVVKRMGAPDFQPRNSKRWGWRCSACKRAFASGGGTGFESIEHGAETTEGKSAGEVVVVGNDGAQNVGYGKADGHRGTESAGNGGRRSRWAGGRKHTGKRRAGTRDSCLRASGPGVCRAQIAKRRRCEDGVGSPGDDWAARRGGMIQQWMARLLCTTEINAAFFGVWRLRAARTHCRAKDVHRDRKKPVYTLATRPASDRIVCYGRGLLCQPERRRGLEGLQPEKVGGEGASAAWMRDIACWTSAGCWCCSPLPLLLPDEEEDTLGVQPPGNGSGRLFVSNHCHHLNHLAPNLRCVVFEAQGYDKRVYMQPSSNINRRSQ